MMTNDKIKSEIEKREYAIDNLISIIKFMDKFECNSLSKYVDFYSSNVRKFINIQIDKIKEEIKSSGCVYEPDVVPRKDNL